MGLSNNPPGRAWKEGNWAGKQFGGGSSACSSIFSMSTAFWFPPDMKGPAEICFLSVYLINRTVLPAPLTVPTKASDLQDAQPLLLARCCSFL